MAGSTAKGEAMQAIRLLYRYAVKHQGAEHETLYQARRLLEEHFEGSHTPETAPDDEDMTHELKHSPEHVYNGAVFRVGEYIFSDYGPRLEKGQIQSISVSPHEMITYNVGGWHFCIKLSDIFHLNRKGSFK